jgi:hypothetical protein
MNSTPAGHPSASRGLVLISPEATFMTGQIIVVDGGLTA